MEATTEVIVESASELASAIAYNNNLLESINTYLQVAFILVVGVLLYKFITAFTGT